MTPRLRRFALWFAAALAAGGARATEVHIDNPGFENPGPGYPVTLPGWTVQGPLQVLPAPPGADNGEFSGYVVSPGGAPWDATSLSQQLGVIQAGTYTFSIHAASDWIGGAALYADTGLGYPLSFAGFSYTDKVAEDASLYSTSVVVAAGSALIGKHYGILITGYGATSYYDNVHLDFVSSVPEPAPVGLMLAGLACLGAAHRRRAAQAAQATRATQAA